MTGLLSHTCNLFGNQNPTYTPRDMMNIDGFVYCRFYDSMFIDQIGSNVVCLGKFANNDEDAKEDVVASLIDRLLSTSGKKIQDLNFYTIRKLEVQLHQALHEKSNCK